MVGYYGQKPSNDYSSLFFLIFNIDLLRLYCLYCNECALSFYLPLQLIPILFYIIFIKYSYSFLKFRI